MDFLEILTLNIFSQYLAKIIRHASNTVRFFLLWISIAHTPDRHFLCYQCLCVYIYSLYMSTSLGKVSLMFVTVYLCTPFPVPLLS